VAALRAAGATVAAGADNLQDPFCTVGRGDPFETAALMVMVAHLTPAEAWAMVSDDARAVLGLPVAGPRPGAVADLVAVAAPDVAAAVADGAAGRVVVRGGRLVARTTVDVELDDRLG
jgi:cytosine deaminase